MRRRMLSMMLILAALTLPMLAGRAAACSLCDSRLALSPTFRHEAGQPTARLILYGSIENPRLTAGGNGVCDLNIKAVLRSDRWLGEKKVVALPRYLAGGKFLVFCDLDADRLDPYRGVPLKSDASVAYVKQALALTAKDPAANLAFFFRHLDDSAPEVARDAYSEFARAGDREVALAAPKLDADKVRAWLQDPKTPPERLSLYAMILGASGKPEDADLLRRLLEREERFSSAADGLLAGYVHLKPREGWQLIHAILADGKRPLTMRLAALRTLRFAYGANSRDNRANVVKGLAAVLAEGELADLAAEDLRRWEVWDLTPNVLALYGKKGFESPLMQRAVLRYALSCKATPESTAFLAARRVAEPDVVKEVEESLKLEKAP